MTEEQWKKIKAAREALGLGEQASPNEIRKAYRRLSKKHHPDLAASSLPRDGIRMQQLTEAYQNLLDYADHYRLPLVPPAGELLAEEDWWMNRFGNDPLWGKGYKVQDEE